MTRGDHHTRNHTPPSKKEHTTAPESTHTLDVAGTLPDATLEPPSTPPLRWEKIYEARQRLEQGEFQDPADLEAVADWLDSVFGSRQNTG